MLVKESEDYMWLFQKSGNFILSCGSQARVVADKTPKANIRNLKDLSQRRFLILDLSRDKFLQHFI